MSTQAQRDKHAAYMRKWNAAHPGNASMQYHKKKAAEPEYFRTKNNQWRKANPALVALARRRYLEKNREKVLAGKRVDYLRHKSKRIEASKAYAANNRERTRAIKSAWKKRNPQQRVESESRRRARKVAATVEDCCSRIAILKRQRFCHWCCDFMPLGTATIDHVIPLARGGQHCRDNLVAACHKCNSSKGQKTLNEWMQYKKTEFEEAA